MTTIAPPPATAAQPQLVLGPGLVSLVRPLGVTRCVAAGQALIADDEPATKLVVIERGVIRLGRRPVAHKSLTVDLLGAGSAVGVLRPDDAHQAGWHAEAHTASQAIVLSAAAIAAAADQTPQLAQLLQLEALRRDRRLVELVDQLSWWSADQRVAALVLDLARRFGTPRPDGATLIPVPVPGHVLASMVGLSRKSLTAALTPLLDSRIVGRDGRLLVVRDAAALARRLPTGDARSVAA